MDLITPIIIGIALSMDCFCSLSCCRHNNEIRTPVYRAHHRTLFRDFPDRHDPARVGAWPGFTGFIAGFDHWLAVLLLAIIGAKMIHEGFETGTEETISTLQFVPVMIISLTTSIDALSQSTYRLHFSR